MVSFEYQPATRIVFGNGTVGRLGALARELGARRVLVVSDPGIEAAGHLQRGLDALHEAGLSTLVFTGVEENPTTRHVRACVEMARGQGIDLIVGLGGGSSIDTAKGANFLLTNGGEMADYWGVGKASRPMFPMIAVPTTAGTGSEAQSFALIADEHTHRKMACGDKKALCKVALLDPTLTVSQPERVTAVSGIDAIAHAIETYVTTRRNPMSLLFAREAWNQLRVGFPRVIEDPTDLEGRGRMLWGAHLAGLAIENSMLGATHSAANPLTAHFGVTHGAAVGLMLPHVVRHNAEVCDEWYRELEPHAAESAGGALATRVTTFLRMARLPEQLIEYGVPEESLGQLARDAAQEWTAQFNPRPVAVEDFERLYRQAYNGKH